MIFANIVLFGWPLVVLLLFRSLSKPTAFLAAIIAGYLLLPTQLTLDLPILPALNKDSIPVLTAFFVILLQAQKPDESLLSGWVPRSWVARFLLALLIGSAAMTALTNTDQLAYGGLVLPGLRPWDVLSTILTTLVLILPFLLGRKLLAHPAQQIQVMLALAVSAGLYSFLALYEVRMSPQLNNMIYGFFPHSFAQHIRGDGFRPIVFLSHGLWLAIFLAMAILSALATARLTRQSRRFIFFWLGIWLLLTLILSKSLGALVISLCLAPVVLVLAPRQQLLVASILAGIALVYPMLRGAEIIPVDQITAWAESISAERAQSFSFRVQNEELLLEKAQERPLFGWGGWGRNFVYDETGQGVSIIADGYWVLIIGLGGWARYLGEFGLLCLPVFLLVFRREKTGFGMETALLTLVLTANLIDLLPNATITPLTWMIAGALWGRLELEIPTTDASQDTAQAPPEKEQHPQYRPPPANLASRQRYTRQGTRAERKRPHAQDK